jgi:negative regulator of sigma E activity
MEDHRLGDLLRELTPEHARPGFTARVMNRLDAPEDRRLQWRPRLALAGAMAAVAAVAISAGVLTNRPAGSERSIETTEAQQILRELRAEHGRLERELREMSEPPVLYLGGDEEVDLVLDLRNVQDTEGMVPAAFHNQTF